MKGRNEIRFVISRFSPSHFLNVELKLFLSKMIIFRAKKKMKEDLFRGCPRRSTIHSRKESTGVVSGCRESNEISPIYTLANNRGDRDDLWPLRRWFIVTDLYTFIPTVLLSPSFESLSLFFSTRVAWNPMIRPFVPISRQDRVQ